MPSRPTAPASPLATARGLQQGLARRQALLAALGVGAAAAGAWWGLRQHGGTAPHTSTPTTSTADTASAAPAVPSASAPLLQGDLLQAGFWQQSFDTPAGGTLSLGATQGHPMLLNFWATWCPPCVKEMPELERFHREFGARGWRVIGLAIDGPTPVREFLHKVQVGFDIGLAGFGGTELAQALGNDTGGLPFSVLVDAQGRIRHRKMGATHFDELAAWAQGLASV
ncbi:MAG: TlpA family protein disulfide reductase [Proteobacteria bacterium]|uniref:TlpA disulfide reductase family protein n=1 Tax=Aquabacterium sp. TaxID=1872578 RepID=UPI0035C7241C|nr:TlpA family protein disulfide reductase [Pseudomonadota bacterium]